jgi:hypothetical protein
MFSLPAWLLDELRRPVATPLLKYIPVTAFLAPCVPVARMFILDSFGGRLRFADWFSAYTFWQCRKLKLLRE